MWLPRGWCSWFGCRFWCCRRYLALQNILQNGDHIVAADNIYGGTYNLITHTLSTQGVSYTIVDPRNFEQVEAAIQDNTKALYAETFGNPNSDVTDIDKLAEIAHRHNIPLIIDNTFGTPYLIRPIEHGADIVVHSATKFIGGHGSSLGGVIVDGGKFDWKQMPTSSLLSLSQTHLIMVPYSQMYRSSSLRNPNPCGHPS